MNCTFTNYESFYQKMYTCVVNNFHNSLNDRKVTEITGNHESGKSNSDVKQIFFKHQNTPYFPLGLGNFFPNVEIFYIMKSNLQYLMNGDLDGLDNLKIFDVSHNPVEYLTKNFFAGKSTIRKISFYDCHLKKVEDGAFEGLTGLKAFFFDQNPCIDIRFDGDNFYDSRSDKAEEYIYDIYDKCKGLNHSMRSNLTEICHATNIEKHILENDEHSSSMWSTLSIILLAFTMLLNIIFAFLLVKILRNNFGGNWHEMKSVLI